MADHNIIGQIGENISTNYLRQNGFRIIERNFRLKYGEIDIVCKRGKFVHFVEVKTVSYETAYELRDSVSRETYRPEDNVHPHKLKRLSHAIQAWMLNNQYDDEWQLDVLTVRLVPHEKYAVFELIENIVVE